MEKQNKNEDFDISQFFEKEEPSDPNLFNKLCMPGIFRIQCLPTQRTYFAEAMETWLELASFISMCQEGKCHIEKLQEDFTKYGPDNFQCDILITSLEFLDKKKRLIALEEYKKSWPGELY